MAQVVVSGAQLACVFGQAPSTLTVVPAGAPVRAGGQLVAKVTDTAPMLNIAPFGACITLTNPQVAAATSAALGTLTPQPCIPVITGPWSPGSPTVLVGGTPAVTNTSQCMCTWGGVITISSPGQETVATG